MGLADDFKNTVLEIIDELLKRGQLDNKTWGYLISIRASISRSGANKKRLDRALQDSPETTVFLNRQEILQQLEEYREVDWFTGMATFNNDVFIEAKRILSKHTKDPKTYINELIEIVNLPEIIDIARDNDGRELQDILSEKVERMLEEIDRNTIAQQAIQDLRSILPGRELSAILALFLGYRATRPFLRIRPFRQK